jgi:polar amino acid transport system substrate-binding protein
MKWNWPLSLLLSFHIAHATELTVIVSADFDPLTYSTPEGGSGAMYDVAKELAKRVGQKFNIQFVPWARAQVIAKTEPNIGILPLARVPEREADYTWLVEIHREPYVFFALKDSKVDISTLEATRNLRIGTFAGSLSEVLLHQKGFKNFKSVATDAQNARMLKTGRIDAWVAPLSFRSRYKEKGGLSAEDLRVGATLVTLHEYLAASKNLDAETIKKWREAFKAMKRDGSYATIMKKYGFEPLK